MPTYTFQNMLSILPVDRETKADLTSATHRPYGIDTELAIWDIFQSYRAELVEIAYEYFRAQALFLDGPTKQLWKRAEQEVDAHFADILSGKIAQQQADATAIQALRAQLAEAVAEYRRALPSGHA